MWPWFRCLDQHFQAVHKAIEDGRIGKVEMVTITSRDPGPPPAEYIKVSGGIFRDMTIHDFDMARFLLGEEVDSVFATGSVLVNPEIGALGDFDSASIILTTKSGRQAIISNSRRATYGYDQRIEVHGSLGSAAAENQRPVSIEIANAEYTYNALWLGTSRTISMLLRFLSPAVPPCPATTHLPRASRAGAAAAVSSHRDMWMILHLHLDGQPLQSWPCSPKH